MAKKNTLEHQTSSGNVFADLGVANAAEHMIKAGLVAKIARIVERRELSHRRFSQAAIEYGF